MLVAAARRADTILLMAKTDALSSGTADSARRADTVYATLRHAIVHGDLQPNQRLVEAELAEALSVSRTPVREVLQRLLQDGLVTSHRRGWVVREHGSNEIRDIYACRAALEGYAARLAALNAGEEHLAELAAILDSADPRQMTREQMVDVNERFHEAIINACGNPLLADLCRRSRLYYFNRRVAQLYTEDEARKSRAEHERLLGALQAREPDLAERITREHIEGALNVILTRDEATTRRRLVGHG
jgi:DNA-binding GntR family transcriptional regulator